MIFFLIFLAIVSIGMVWYIHQIVCESRFFEKQLQTLQIENAALQKQSEQDRQFQNKYDELLEKYVFLQKENSVLATNLEQEKKNLLEKIQLLEKAERKLSDTFKALSSDALSKNNQDLITLAKSLFEQMQEKSRADMEMNSKNVSELLNPIKTALSGVGIKLEELEKCRVGAYEALRQQVSDLMQTENILKTETNNLVSALKAPNIRGRWGEIQLHRVVELAGMLEHCDFEEQVTSSEDSSMRPDMIIYYPGSHRVVVDAKTPLFAYLQALDATDEQRKKSLLREYVTQIKKQVSLLSSKQYWSKFEFSPEFVIMFLPGEVFLSVAVENDPSLMEFAMQKRVIITTPTLLLALLQTISLGWQQQKMAEDVEQIRALGQELYQRLAGMSEYISNLGRSLDTAVRSYNAFIGNMESRVLVNVRKFAELKNGGNKEILELVPIDNCSREMKRP